MTITRKPNMNRVYITDAESIVKLLSDFRARREGDAYWLPLHMEAKLRAAIEEESAYQCKIAADLALWVAANSVIPAGYKRRHGAMFGGEINIGGERMDEPGITAPNLPWTLVASHEKRVRDLTGTSSINGRVMDSETLYSAITDDGRPIYRIAHSSGFGDDLRETYWLPDDLWARMMAAEVKMRGITPESALEWLAKSRGCVGTELYEFAVSPLPCAPAAPRLSA